MDDAFDRAVIAGAFRAIAQAGWQQLSLVDVARAEGLPIDRVRARFPGRWAVLARFGLLADQAALGAGEPQPSVRDRLFDMIMRRIDVLQAHRAGVLALLRALPADPATAMFLACCTDRSMAWLLDAAGDGAQDGSPGARQLRRKGLGAVWLWTVRAWQQDETADLATTMSALDSALTRAEQAAAWMGGRRSARTEPPASTAAEDLPPVAATAPMEPPASPPV